MAARRILTLFFAAFVLAEARWHVQKRESPSICDPMSGKVSCFCIKNSQNLDHIKSADCFITVENIKPTDHAWNSFEQLKTALKITLTNSRGISLQYIPTHALKHLKDLLQLDVKYGKIEKVPPFAFANLSNVVEMNIRDSQIQILQKHSFAHHSHLKDIKLDKNRIVEINRDVFIDLPSLEKLYLTANQITTIHDKAFIHLGHLKELEINMNKLFSLNSETFSGLEKLQKLDLSSNNLEVIGDNTFYPLKNLISLNLEGNKIQMIDDRAFHGLAELQFLTLAHNKLSNIVNDVVFVGLESLVTLSIRGNEIKDLNYKAIAPLESNFQAEASYFDVEDNPFACDCKLDWFMQLMNKTRSKVLRNALENIKCLPDSKLKEQWNKLDDVDRNSGQIFDDEDPTPPPGTEYEYYDESQLNGKLFYTDVKDLLHCDKSRNEVATPKIPMLVTAAMETKVTSPPTTYFTTPSTISSTRDLNNQDTSSKSMNKVSTTQIVQNTKKPVEIRTAKPHKPGLLDLSMEETTPKAKDVVENEIVQEYKPDSYTTSRLVNVSAKPINVYENMAADEAKPDKLKAQRSLQSDPEEVMTGKANKSVGCAALILLFCARLFH